MKLFELNNNFLFLFFIVFFQFKSLKEIFKINFINAGIIITTSLLLEEFIDIHIR